jgi:hypothetical protein
MPTSQRVVAARLRRAQLREKHRKIDSAFTEAYAASDATLTAASSLSAALAAGMIDSDDVYELLRIIHLRQNQTLHALEEATGFKTGRTDA